MGADIGAIQRQDILFDPTYLLAGYTAGDVTNPLYGNVVLPSASNVWFGTDNYGARYYYLGDRLGTLASDGGNRYFISYRNTLPNDVAVGTWININGKYAQIDFIDDVTCRLTNIPVDFPANGSGYLAAFYTALTGSVPSKRASSIIVPGDLRDGTEIDNVTGILKSPVEDNVRDGIPYGASDEYTGTLTLPAENKVLSGQNYGAAGIELSGNVTLPDEDRVITETQYGELGTEFTGDFVVPAESEVQIAVTFGPASDPLVGTFVGDCGDTYPDPDAVLDTETGWGEGYSQTGTYHAPDAIEVIDIAFFGPSSSIQGEYETGLLDPTPDTGIRVTMEEQEIYNEGSTIGFRIKITAHGDDVSPLPDDKVFLYQRRLVRPEGNITEDVFIAVCSPMDMEVYAADAPAEDSEPTFFRLNTLDVIHTSKTVLLEAWEDLKADLTKLANTMQDMDTLAKSEVLEYEWENTEPSSTTPSLSGTGLLLTMEEQEVYTEENTPGYRIKITAYGDDVEPLPDDKIFLYQRRLLQPEGNVTEDVFTAVCSVMDTQVYPADEPTDNSEPAFFRLNTVDVIHTSKTVLLEAWEDMKTDVASLVQTIQNMDDLADGESVTFNW